MAALAERRIIPHEELKARAEEKSEAEARPEHMRLLEALLFAAAVPLDELWHAVPAFPTRSEVWLKLLEAYGL